MYLTRREQQVIELVAQGCTDQQVGKALFLSYKTTKVHLLTARQKMGALNRAHAVARAYELGLLQVGDPVLVGMTGFEPAAPSPPD